MHLDAILQSQLVDGEGEEVRAPEHWFDERDAKVRPRG